MADYNPTGRTRLQKNEVGILGGQPNPRVASPHSKFSSDVEFIYDGLRDLLLSKHNDYGSRNISDSPGGAINGLRVRMHDKLARINNLVDRNVSPQHESLEDSFKDMANYAIIGLLVLQGKWDNK